MLLSYFFPRALRAAGVVIPPADLLARAGALAALFLAMPAGVAGLVPGPVPGLAPRLVPGLALGPVIPRRPDNHSRVSGIRRATDCIPVRLADHGDGGHAVPDTVEAP